MNTAQLSQSASMTDEPTINDVLVALNQFSTHIESVMVTKNDLTESFAQFKNAFKTELKSELKHELKSELVAELSQKLVTKDYLDKKLASLRGDLLGVDHKTNHQVTTLVHTLQNNKTITTEQTQSILVLSPYTR